MEHNITASYGNVRVRPICKNDLEFLRKWRNEIKVHFLTQMGHITPEMQEAWHERNKFLADSYMFAIDEVQELNRLVGSAALYDIKNNIAEYGRVLVGDSYAHGKGVGYMATVLCLYVGFEKLRLARVIANVHEDNHAAVKSYSKAGFETCKSYLDNNGHKMLEIAIEKNDFYRKHDFLAEIKM